jgi:hypothetical protein
MVNLNLWVSLTETEYALLTSAYGDEYAMKFAMNRVIRKLVEEKSKECVSTHIEIDNDMDIA